jgi:hypothetical protein
VRRIRSEKQIFRAAGKNGRVANVSSWAQRPGLWMNLRVRGCG